MSKTKHKIADFQKQSRSKQKHVLSPRLSSYQMNSLFKQQHRRLRKENQTYKQYFNLFKPRFELKVRQVELLTKQNQQLRKKVKEYQNRASIVTKRTKSLKTIKSSNNIRFYEESNFDATKLTNSNCNSFL